MLRVTHWLLKSSGGPIDLTFDTHPMLLSRPAVTIAGPSIRDLPEELETLDTLGRWLRERHAAGSVVGSICSGIYLLAHAGLLDGRAATTHWCHATDFAERYPKVRLDAAKLVVDDGDIITSGAVMAWIDLGLKVVDRLLGTAVTVATARYMLFDPAGREQRHYSDFAPRLNHGDAPVLKVQHWLQTTGGRGVNLTAMADRAGLEARTFERRFFKATGFKPIEYCQNLRVARARERLEFSALPISKIAWEVGYSDEAAFRRIFRRVVGLSPSAYRLRFRLVSADANDAMRDAGGGANA